MQVPVAVTCQFLPAESVIKSREKETGLAAGQEAQKSRENAGEDGSLKMNHKQRKTPSSSMYK